MCDMQDGLVVTWLRVAGKDYTTHVALWLNICVWGIARIFHMEGWGEILAVVCK